VTAELHLVHLYPTVMNLYGDRGNITVLAKRCAWRDIDLVVHPVGLGDSFPTGPIDMLFMGGDQDREQAVVVDDLRTLHAGEIESLVAGGTPFLAVCGGYQLLQKYYRPAEGPDLIGVGIIDAYTIHPGHDVPRRVGNIAIRWGDASIVGFENHGGRTYLEGDTQPLGTVIHGFGNNGEDGTEGARLGNVFGTYIHGSLLPKNPAFADYLLKLALRRRHPDIELSPLDDELEGLAHTVAMKRAAERV
jgi:lipid II isoglutaminyl synthase (glutamine-hydrolysing)